MSVYFRVLFDNNAAAGDVRMMKGRNGTTPHSVKIPEIFLMPSPEILLVPLVTT